MNTFKISLALFTYLVISVCSLNAQNISINYLPTPQLVAPQYGQNISSKSIHYGATPANLDPKKPVIVYVHGFSDLAGIWFGNNNQMYANTYNAGQHAVFVAMTAGEGMWENGEILADMLDIITEHYGVEQVVIVAHSNGGKASEVAMITENRRNKVSRVISLGTPFSGTPLANVAQIPGLNLISSLIGLGGGMRTSTTYYMGGYARPLLDWSWRNEPGKFVNFGAWGYNNGSNDLSLVLTAGGLVLNILGASSFFGGNDGVTPYWSSDRPNGRQQWTTGYGNPVSQFDHTGVALSQNVWTSLEPMFSAPLSSLRVDQAKQNSAQIANAKITSKLQFLSSEDKNMSFIVEKSVRDLSLNIIHASEDDVFELRKMNLDGTAQIVDFNLNELRETLPLMEGKSSRIALNNLSSGTYTIVSKSSFAAIVSNKKGVELEYDNQHQFAFSAQPELNVKLNHATQYDLSKLSLKAIITHEGTLKGEAVKTSSHLIENFEVDAEGNARLKITQALPNGVYNVLIHAEHPEFKKSLVTGFVLNQAAAVPAKKTVETTLTSLSVYPNPAKDFIQISFENDQAAQVNLYDINGRMLHQQMVQETGQQQLQLDLNQLELSQGTYFLEVQIGAEKMTEIFVKIP
jgi:pimeloyl-ACP methyl ester carboxylesterase